MKGTTLSCFHPFTPQCEFLHQASFVKKRENKLSYKQIRRKGHGCAHGHSTIRRRTQEEDCIEDSIYRDIYLQSRLIKKCIHLLLHVPMQSKLSRPIGYICMELILLEGMALVS